MTDEDKKRIVSEPPPPTDEIDGEWGDDDETLVRDAPSLSDPPKVSVRPSGTAASSPAAAAPVSDKPPASVPQAAQPAETAAGPISDPPVAAAAAAVEEEDDEEEDDEEEEDAADEEEEDEEEEDEEEASAQPAHLAAARGAAQDWIPEWGPFAVLGLLVCISIFVGLGLVGGPAAKADEDGAGEAKKAAPAPSALKPHSRPSPH